MDTEALINLIQSGETSFVQLKENVTNATSIAQEMVAFSNSKGGKIIIGVNDKTGSITGLQFKDIQRINSLLTTAANEHIKSSIIIETETFDIDGKKVIVATVPEGIDKPYMDKEGLIFVKNGSDKRKVTSKDELARLLQSSGNLYAEEKLIQHSSFSDFNWDKFQEFYVNKYSEEPDKNELDKYIINFHLGKDGKLNVAGALLFGKNVQKLLPQFFMSAVWFAGNDLADTVYRSSENITGTLYAQYSGAFDFIKTKINYVQGNRSFNSVGMPEIPLIVFQEMLVNALVHRDYFINDSVKVFIFQNRIEIKSPGKLPNNLTVDDMKIGIRKSRNSTICSLAYDLLDYRGIGSGVVRSLKAYPHIELINNQSAEQFTVVIHRPENI